MTNLTREDFTIFDEGRPQTISVFEQVRLSLPSVQVASTSGLTTAQPVSVATNDVAPDGRVFALMLDDQLTQPFRTLSVRRLAREFVQQYVGPSDLVGVFSTGGRGALTQEFTTDRARVFQAIERFQGNRSRQTETDPERVYSIQTAMDTVAELSAHLTGIRGRRVAMLLFSEGIDYNVFQGMKASAIPNTVDAGDFAALLGVRGPRPADRHEPEPTAVIRAVQEAMDALSRANVVLYGIDPRGLYSPDGEWVEFNPRDETTNLPPTPEEHSRSIQSLRTLSERTGGFAAVNTNKFGPDFQRIVEENSHYYVLGYSPTSRGESGQYRRIRVRVRPGLVVTAREGYIVPPIQPATASTRPVLAALDDALPKPDLPLRVQAIVLPSVGDLAFRPVQLLLEIDGKALAFREEAGKFSERLELAVKTLDGQAKESNRSATEMTLPPLTAPQRDRIAQAGIRWMTSVNLPPGRHNLRVAAHSETSGRTGSVFVDIEVPETSASRIVLSDLALTATSAGETPTGGAASILPPLSGPPTTRRMFRRGELLTVGAAVEPSLEGPPVVTAVVYHREGDEFQAIPTDTVPVLRTGGGGGHVTFSLPTQPLEPGRFLIRVTAQPPGEGRRADVREVQFELLPAQPSAMPTLTP